MHVKYNNNNNYFKAQKSALAKKLSQFVVLIRMPEKIGSNQNRVSDVIAINKYQIMHKAK